MVADLSTAEANARAALACDPLERVAISAEEACALFDRVRELEARELERLAAPWPEDQRSALNLTAVAAMLGCAPTGDIVLAARSVLDRVRDLENEAARTRSEVAQEIELLKRDRDERLATCLRGEQHERKRNADLVQLLAETEARLASAEGGLADTIKRLDILRAAYEAETGRACRI